MYWPRLAMVVSEGSKIDYFLSLFMVTLISPCPSGYTTRGA